MSITSANAVLMLAVTGVFNAPQRIQQFAADDIFTNDPVPASEVMMGVDGYLAAGFVFSPVPWRVSLMADSLSNQFFDDWYRANVNAKDTYRSNGTILLPSLSKKFDLNNGALTTYPNMPDAARILRPRNFVITWQSVTPSNMNAVGF